MFLKKFQVIWQHYYKPWKEMFAQEQVRELHQLNDTRWRCRARALAKVLLLHLKYILTHLEAVV